MQDATLQELHQAVAAHQAGDLAGAERLCRQVLAARPDDAQALQLLGAVRGAQGDMEDAERLLRQALAAGDEPVVLRNLALLLRRTGREGEALALLERWTRLEPQSATAWAALGRTCAAAGQLAEAESAYRHALALEPRNARVLQELGQHLREQRRLEEAAGLLQEAAAARPADAGIWNDLGTVLHGLALQKATVPDASGSLPQEAAAAFDAYRRACSAASASPDPWCNAGALHQQLGQLTEAEAAFRRALSLAPEHWQANLNLGHLLLLRGAFPEGWRHYGFRHSHPEPAAPPPDHLPRWAGDSLAGRAVLMWHEQGHGDTVQFVRYAAVLKALGARRVGAACPPALARLLRTAPGLDEVTGTTAEPEAYDCWVHYLDIPMHLGTQADTLPARIPYLYAELDAARAWAARLPQGRPRVGIAWKGSRIHGNDRHRSLPGLAALSPLWRVPGVQFVSLQKGPGEEEARQPPAGQPLVDIGSQLSDFSDTAAVVSGLDLVICVDTALAHVAGALGRRVWVLLPHVGLDWRWLLDREDSPWYPGVMRLFRQRRPGDWGAVVEQVAVQLAAFVRRVEKERRGPGRNASE